jgi:hypothetical protein
MGNKLEEKRPSRILSNCMGINAAVLHISYLAEGLHCSTFIFGERGCIAPHLLLGRGAALFPIHY